jgi:hypothetical protein
MDKYKWFQVDPDGNVREASPINFGEFTAFNTKLFSTPEEAQQARAEWKQGNSTKDDTQLILLKVYC